MAAIGHAEGSARIGVRHGRLSLLFVAVPERLPDLLGTGHDADLVVAGDDDPLLQIFDVPGGLEPETGASGATGSGRPVAGSDVAGFD
jgi:hypothetical protein